MSQPSLFAAKLLESSASAYAGYAASLLLERHPDAGDSFAPHAMREWKANLTQRVLELAAALGAEEPQLFASRVRWAEKTFRVREIPTEGFRRAMVCLSEVLDQQLPEAARQEVGECVEQALQDLSLPAGEVIGLDPREANGRLALQYLQRVLEGDARGAIDLVTSAVADGLEPHAAYLEVLVPAQREIGEMWHLGDVSVAEEHFVTATTERAMSIIVQRSDCRPANGRTVVCAAVAGNGHGLGVRVVADFFEMDGWRAVCLGANVPRSDLTVAVQYYDADLVLLSAARINDLKEVGETSSALRGLKDRELKIMAGGAAFAESPELWRRLGADGHSGSAEEAVALGARLLGIDSAD